MRHVHVVAGMAALLLTGCSQTTGDTADDAPSEAADEMSAAETSPADSEMSGGVMIPPEAAEYCAIVLADPQFDGPPETPEEYEEQYTAFLENDRRLAEAAPAEVAEDVQAIVDNFADFVITLEANGWSPEGLDDVEIWDQDQVDRVHAYDVATCGAPERP